MEHLAQWIGCLPFMQEVKGLTPTIGMCENNFSDPINQDIGTQCALSWKNSRLVTAVSEHRQLGPPYQTGKTVHVHTKTQKGQMYSAGCAWPWFRTAEPLRECCYENWITITIGWFTSKSSSLPAYMSGESLTVVGGLMYTTAYKCISSL